MVKIDANPPDRGSSPASLPPSCDDNDADDDGRDGDSGRWVTVAAFSLPQQAHLARLRLESEEIDCFLIDENLVATDWLLANAVGGIKVKVHEADAQQARAILGTRAVLADDAEKEADAEADDDLSHHIDCPSCGSADVERAWFSRRLFFLGFLIGLPLPVPMRIWRCTRCHHEWKHQPGFPISDGKSGEG